MAHEAFVVLQMQLTKAQRNYVSITQVPLMTGLLWYIDSRGDTVKIYSPSLAMVTSQILSVLSVSLLWSPVKSEYLNGPIIFVTKSLYINTQ